MGLQIPSSGFPYWLFPGAHHRERAILMNEAGNKVDFANPAVVEALQFFVDLSRKDKIMRRVSSNGARTPKDFFERKTAMMWTTTGNLTNVKGQRTVRVRRRPAAGEAPSGIADRRRQFYLFKKTSPEQRAVALEFAKFMTTPERAAEWASRPAMSRSAPMPGRRRR